MPNGPQPSRADRPRPAALRVLRALVAAEGPLTITELQAGLGGHPNAVRQQLTALVGDGFAGSQAVMHGRGRPAQRYYPTPSGRQVATQEEQPADPALIAAIADYLSATEDPQAAALALGRSWGRRVEAGTDLSALLARQGFSPVPDADGLRLLTCPLLEAARRHPSVVCSLHQGLLEAVAGAPVKLRPFGAVDGCVVR